MVRSTKCSVSATDVRDLPCAASINAQQWLCHMLSPENLRSYHGEFPMNLGNMVMSWGIDLGLNI